MKKVIYLHIGFHKTGTSAIQEALAENRNALKKAGVFYPESELRFPAQQELAWALIEEKRAWMKVDEEADALYGRLLKRFEASDAGTLLISSEDFTFLEKDRESVERIRRYFANYDCRLICYVRDPIDFIASLYTHRLRVADTDLIFQDYLIKHINPNVAMFHDRLRNWEDVFGVENIILRSYDPARFEGGSVQQDFLQAIGVDVTLGRDERRSNEGVHAFYIELQARLNQSELSDEDRAFIAGRMSEIRSRLPRASVKELFLDDAMRAFLDKLYAPMRKEIHRKYGVRV